MPKSNTLRIVLLASLAIAQSACEQPPAGQAHDQPAGPVPNQPDPNADYVGSEACGGCHGAEWESWRDSHHDLALQIAGEDSVLAEFGGHHLESLFEQEGANYRITPDDEAAMDVVYTFGVTPLQQYVIAADGGALQTYPIAWDGRAAEDGGQRWFNLNPELYPSGDPMHWAGRANRWNSQCADCHSTAVEKNYDPETRTYATTFEVEDVGCEACHGPGSDHAADPVSAPLAKLADQESQIEVCAPCHSRRSHLSEGFRPGSAFLDHYAPRLLTPDLYHVDGQIDDEVYVYGSFLQSRMHAAGVTCSNCHDPHQAGLKRSGNDTCTFCHQNSPEKTEFAELSAGLYDGPEHHLHEPGTPGAQCVSCHMPEKIYMGVDGRRDHSFRIPRPDLAEFLDVPEPCTVCHQDRDAEWAADIVEKHFGPVRPPHFAETFASADRLATEADAALASLVSDASQPIMVRASALARLGGYARGYTLDAIRLATRGESLLRYAAPLAAASLNPETRWRLLASLLDDELRAVRHQAVTALLPTVGRDPAFRERLAPHLAAWQADQSLNLDFPETLTNIAGAQAAVGDLAGAEASFNAALELQANWVPGLLNLADLYRLTGRDPEAGTLITRALALAPDQPEVSYGYALWLSRQGRLDESLTYFNQASVLAPERSQFTYTLALALNDSGDGARAVEVLEKLLTRWPEDQQALMALVTMLRDQQKFTEALPYLDRLLELRPGDSQLIEFRSAMAAAAAAA